DSLRRRRGLDRCGGRGIGQRRRAVALRRVELLGLALLRGSGGGRRLGRRRMHTLQAGRARGGALQRVAVGGGAGLRLGDRGGRGGRRFLLGIAGNGKRDRGEGRDGGEQKTHHVLLGRLRRGTVRPRYVWKILFCFRHLCQILNT